MHIVVVVLGDLGRSPRMQYHCQSLLDAGHHVSFVGYDGEALIDALVEQEGKRLRVIRFHVPTMFENKHRVIYFVWRIVSLSLFLAHALFFSVERNIPVDFVLVQNPPALPLLAVVYLYCRIKQFLQKRRPGFIIDWHNLGYSMLTPDGSTFQKIARVYEQTMAPLADGHLTVTKAMKEFLAREMAITNNVDVLYDCPPDMFEPLDAQAQHEILTKLDPIFCKACPRSWWDTKTKQQTLFTEPIEESVQGVPVSFRHRPRRPALVTSSTSWTPDEDFGMLLEALQNLDQKIENETASASSLKVLVVVTGKGPEREMYQEKIARMPLHHVAIATIWLEPGDYPRLLACADLGVSLHTSTSGLDLPMKILDLFGCQVPVVAHGFQCLPELVQDNVNGRIFTTSAQLTELLYELLHPLALSSNHNADAMDSPVLANHSYGALNVYSKQLQGRDRWNANWMEHALPIILKSAHMK